MRRPPSISTRSRALDREPVFDEVLYLRFLTGAAPRGEDLLYLARRYIVGSAIRPRLEEEFESFIVELDRELTDAGLLTDEFPGFEDRTWLWEKEPNDFDAEHAQNHGLAGNAEALFRGACALRAPDEPAGAHLHLAP